MGHTTQFLQKMFDTYMGCEILDARQNIIGKSVSANTTRVWYEHENNKVVKSITQNFALYGDCKLVLTPLSEINDEDAVEVAKICGFEYNNSPDSNAYFDLDGLRNFLVEDVFVLGNFGIINSVQLQRLIDYLRSKKYDCGYLHIPSLIEAGLAVRSNHPST